MSRLNEKERTLLALRFFENKSGAETAALLGIQEWAAHKRATRALEKLRKYFFKHGVTSTAATLGETISTNSVQAAPVLLAKTTTAVALAKGATASLSTLTLIKGALKIMAWTKAKTAIVVGATVILATGTTTIVIKRTIQARMDDPSIADSFFDSRNLWRAPSNVIVLRQTHFTDNAGAMMEIRTRPGGKQEDRMLGRNQSVGQIFEAAYGLPDTETRIIIPEDLPRKNYDYLITLPVSQEEQLKALQAEIKTKLGLVAHFAAIETNVLLLKSIIPGVTGLKLHSASPNAGVTAKAGQIYALGQSTRYLTTMVEYALKLPIIDQTGLVGKRFDYVLDEQLFEGTRDGTKVKDFLRNQLGLELVPTNMPIEMLVVEKAR